jgi:chromosome segregation ATPase
MFSFHKLEVVHWDWWERFTLPLDASIVTVIGPNGSGKTTLLDALRTLLAIPCSQGRDYKRYVRRADRPYAWLRATVSNPRRPNGQLAFWPVSDDTVTLFCRIRKKGGDWERSYGIGRGDVSIEEADDANLVTWLGVRQYEAQLDGAGLTRAIKRVLALDQGHTDKLCEYSGRQLLELVFDVFGDQEVLDNYRAARQEQANCQRELEELNTQLARLHAQLQAAESDVNSYHEYQRLLAELGDLHGQWLPRLQLAELGETLRGGRAQLLGRRRERNALAASTAEAQSASAGLAARLADCEQNEAAAKIALDGLHAEERRYAKESSRWETLNGQRKRLVERVAAQAQGLDVDAASREQEKLSRRRYGLEEQLSRVSDEARELDQRIAALESGRRPEPAEVAAFRAELERAGVRHCALADIVEITDDHWQGAVEAVLAGVRHLVLLEDPQDRGRAWALGEKLRFRHYIVPDRQPVPKPMRGSLLECVRFSADPPGWLSKLLDNIRRVDSVEDGARLPENQSWITPRGYQRERRGGRDISVSDFHFGRSALAQARARRTQIDEEREGLREALRTVAEKLAAVQAVLAGVDAARELAAREPEFAQAEAEAARLAGEVAQLGERRSAAAQRYHEAIEATRAVAVEQGRVEDRLRAVSRQLQELDESLRAARRGHVEQILEWRRLRRGKPRQWLSAEALAEARARFDTVKAVEHEIERQERRRAEGRYVTDAGCVTVRDKLEADHRQLADRIDAQRAHLDRAAASTERARGQYINVLRGTLRRYAQNLRTLGALASIEVEVEPPHLANDDAALAQASLLVQFNFDQKGMIGLNDGEASGGQQVMKSMILLIGLMMEDDQGGGFVFIDEPFAHLDIFNIDKVGAFLQATRAQYIVTTPNTHNVNVFKPSQLTLMTQKRRPGSAFAPPVAFLRRDAAATAAGKARAPMA